MVNLSLDYCEFLVTGHQELVWKFFSFVYSSLSRCCPWKSPLALITLWVFFYHHLQFLFSSQELITLWGEEESVMIKGVNHDPRLIV